ncbi:galactose-3-O-sulfotransferase 3-like [Branchiostoma lanceolatum]|uniref:galactose-3-O-sulfotransferase 3-like n=1 Tax=Branchiostoma lanceolatum TaxID=7740 RepID=UPI00345260B9
MARTWTRKCSRPVARAVALIFCLGVSLHLHFSTCVSVKESTITGRKDDSDTNRPGNTSSISSPRSYQVPPTCRPKTKLAFIKVHKAASSTMMQILHRFGYLRKLSFVQHRSRDVNGLYPHGLSYPEIIMPPQGESHDILTYHTVYDRPNIVRQLTSAAKFVTILREPFQHFKSAFAFYGYKKIFNITAQNPLETFLENPIFYDNLKRGSYKTRNPMAKDLGLSVNMLSPSHQKNEIANITKQFIDKIFREFDLVMISDHFDESLVLLRRLMCWDLKDVLYYKYNTYKYSSIYDASNISQRLRDTHEEWDAVDYALYEYFNKTLWKKIAAEGESFVQELAHFRDVELKMRTHCNSDYSVLEALVISESPWNSAFKIDSEYCTWVKTFHMCYYYLIRDRNSRYQAGLKGPVADGTVPKNGIFYSPPYCSTECEMIKQECSLHEYVQHCYQEGFLKESQSSSQKIKFIQHGGKPLPFQ